VPPAGAWYGGGMSTVTDPPAAPAFTPTPLPPPHLLDVSGLPDAVVADLRRLVETLRHTLALLPNGPPPGLPQKPLRGMFAEVGKSLPPELIDELRRECWTMSPKPSADPDPS